MFLGTVGELDTKDDVERNTGEHHQHEDHQQHRDYAETLTAGRHVINLVAKDWILLLSAHISL